MIKRILTIMVALGMLLAACAPTPTPKPDPTVTPGPLPTVQPTPGKMWFDVVNKIDSRLPQDSAFQRVPNTDMSAPGVSTVQRIALNPTTGEKITLYQSTGNFVYSTVYTAAGEWVTNLGIGHVKGTNQDILVGQGNGWVWDEHQLQITDDSVVILRLIGRSWAIAFQRDGLNVWRVALIDNWQ